ncbi:hypothetical protein ED312_18370 [Sinomicrobium pectinilyticum]|uniref:Uncharacterized protein n=1 Tax=Sinomicrobium pectinilyticum TaxID=1084421 RepID=A0A3N0E1H5_SINP1|nr:hypothetical protein ED312_18370 [Sinomicrobium pectinilyticum]
MNVKFPFRGICPGMVNERKTLDYSGKEPCVVAKQPARAGKILKSLLLCREAKNKNFLTTFEKS